MQRRLFELATADGCSISPYVWRSKFVLASKGLDYRSELVGFTDIAAIGSRQFKTLPILHEGDAWIGDSWAIADHLDRTHPECRAIAPAAAPGVRFFDRWMGCEIAATLFRICVLDIFHRLRDADRSYFRTSREQRLGHSLEEAHARRDACVPILRQRLQPLRLTLRDQPFVGGGHPDYADYIAAGTLIWGGSVATLALLAADDPLLGWLRRCLALFGGVGADLVLPAFPGLSPTEDH